MAQDLIVFMFFSFFDECLFIASWWANGRLVESLLFHLTSLEALLVATGGAGGSVPGSGGGPANIGKPLVLLRCSVTAAVYPFACGASSRPPRGSWLPRSGQTEAMTTDLRRDRAGGLTD
jgi:hypothetical protein